MTHMKRYRDFENIQDVNWTKYVIVVPSEDDRQELMKGFEHIHYSDIDTDNVVVNQLAHEYLDESKSEGAKNNIIVDKELYEKLKSKR
jgi:hypothetical protein